VVTDSEERLADGDQYRIVEEDRISEWTIIRASYPMVDDSECARIAKLFQGREAMKLRWNDSAMMGGINSSRAVVDAEKHGAEERDDPLRRGNTRSCKPASVGLTNGSFMDPDFFGASIRPIAFVYCF
jgi:hypothetical protein